MNKLISFFNKKAVRITVGIIIPLVCIAGAIYLRNMKGRIPCPFYELTGIYCPGCGASRASRALLNFDILSAIDYNVFFVLFLPIVVYFILKYYIAYVFGRDILPFPKYISYRFGITFIVIIALFTLLRNIPVFPFSYLAP